MQERDDAQEVADEREEQVEALQREVEELRRALEARSLEEKDELEDDEGMAGVSQSMELDDDDADGETDGEHDEDGDDEHKPTQQLLADLTVQADTSIETANQSNATISTRDGEDSTDMSFTGNLTAPPPSSQSPMPNIIPSESGTTSSTFPSIKKIKRELRPRSSSIASSSASIKSSRRSSLTPSLVASISTPARGILTTEDRSILRAELTKQHKYLLSLEATNSRLTVELERLRDKARNTEILREEKLELEKKVERLETKIEEVLLELETTKKAAIATR